MPAAAKALDLAARRRGWFARAGREAGAAGRWASLLTTADAFGAVAFVGGLAMALTALPLGMAAAAPGAALMVAAGTCRGLLGVAAAARGADAAARVKSVARANIVRADLAARPGERAPLGQAMARAVEGIEALDGYFARFAPARTASSGAVVITLGAMAIVSPFSAAIVLMTFAPFVVAMILAGSSAAREQRRRFVALARLSGLFADKVRALPVILAFQAQERETQALGAASRALADATLAVLRIAFVSSAALEFFAALSVALVAVYCGFNLLRLLPFPAPEQLGLARAVFVLALAPEVYFPLRRLAAAYHDRQAAEAAAHELMATPHSAGAPYPGGVHPRAGRRPDPGAGASPRGGRDGNALRQRQSLSPPWGEYGRRPGRGLQRSAMHAKPREDQPPSLLFDHVSVIYPGAVTPALGDFTLRVAAGEIVALMGPTGSGKSTVLNLILGLAQASAGVVNVEGGVFAAWASQSPVTTPGTLADNIALGRLGASAEDIAEAAHAVGLGCDLARPIDERGGGLSGGERRRLALARAMLRDAPLLLLDEPTAHLDSRSEAELLPVIARLARGRTTLIATHSDALAALADRIVRLA